MEKTHEEIRNEMLKRAEKDRKERMERIKERWNNLKPFNDPNDIPQIPIVDEKEYKEFFVPKLIAAGAIPKDKLIDGQVYIGDHRNCTVAKWDAKENVFKYNRHKFTMCYIDECNHFEDDDGFALFVPIKLGTEEDFEKTKL